MTGGEIRLGQFLKLSGVVDAGSDVKHVLAELDVRVNDVPEDRRGRRLVPGDVVAVGPVVLRVGDGDRGASGG